MKIKVLKAIFILLSVGLITACMNRLDVTYSTVPNGAELYESGKLLGRSPILLSYVVNEENRKNGYLRLTEITAVWPSGAKTSTGLMEVDISNVNESYGTWNKTIDRPTNFEGVEIDRAYALELEKTRLLERQAQAINDAQFEANANRTVDGWIDEIYEKQNSVYEQERQRILNQGVQDRTRCESKRAPNGNIITDCY